MSSTEGKEQQLFCEWAKENEDKDIFCRSADDKSYYIERGQNSDWMCRYQFATFKEAEDMIDGILGEKMSTDIRKMAIIAAFKYMFSTENNPQVSGKILEKENGLPEYIYVF